MGESSAKRRARQKNARLRDRAFAGTTQHAEVIDSIEFTSVFLVAGGRQKAGPDAVAYDCNLRRVGPGIVPAFLEIGRDKASKLMAKAQEALAIQARKEALSKDGAHGQTVRIRAAHERNRLSWQRVDLGPEYGRQLVSHLIGSSDSDDDPTIAWENRVVCYRGDDGRYHIGTETFRGGYSEPDVDGIRSRIGVTFLPLLRENGSEHSYADEKEAHRAILFQIAEQRLPDCETPQVRARMAKRLREWRSREDAFERDAEGVRPRGEDDWDFTFTAEVGEAQRLRDSVRVDELTEHQLNENRIESE